MGLYDREFWSAVKILTKVYGKGISVRDIFFSRERKGITSAMVFKLVIETIRRLNYLDALVGYNMLKRLSLKEKNILRVALFMRKFLNVEPPKLPTHLRTLYLKSLKRDPLIDLDDEITALSLKYYHPRWFIRKLLPVLSRDRLFSILRINNLEKEGKWIRVNSIKTSVESFYFKWKQLIPSEFDDIFYAQKSYLKKMLLSSDYRNGLFIVQDFSSAAVVYALDPHEKEHILDLCAAPGIKTSHIAALTRNNSLIIATDISEKRILKMLILRERLNFDAQIILGDSTKPPFKEEAFDKILVDAPCSDTGVFRDRPDLKWNFNPKKLRRVTNLQKALLANAIRLAKKGGIIVYSVCSLLPDEGEEIIKFALENFKNIYVDDINLPRAENGYGGYSFSRKVKRFFPDTNVDGFFIARLIKS